MIIIKPQSHAPTPIQARNAILISLATARPELETAGNKLQRHPGRRKETLIAGKGPSL